MFVIIVYVLLFLIFRDWKKPTLKNARMPPSLVRDVILADPVCFAKALHHNSDLFTSFEAFLLVSKSPEFLQTYGWRNTETFSYIHQASLMCFEPFKKTLHLQAPTKLEREPELQVTLPELFDSPKEHKEEEIPKEKEEQIEKEIIQEIPIKKSRRNKKVRDEL